MKLGYEIDIEFEDEFESKCQEIAMYQSFPRMTIDREWEEDELRDDIYDVCIEVMTHDLLKKYKYCAVKDINLLSPYYMAEYTLNQIDDVVELYNKEYDKHRNEKYFGIKWYDEAIRSMILKNLKENLVK